MGRKDWLVEFVPRIAPIIRPLYKRPHPFTRGEFWGLVDVPRSRILIATEGQDDYAIDATLFHEIDHLVDLYQHERTVRRRERWMFPILWECGLRLS